MAEFRIRGVATNIPFLQAVLDTPELVAGDVSTRSIEERPDLLTSRKPQDRATKLLTWLAEVTVHKPYGLAPQVVDPVAKLLLTDLRAEPEAGARQRLPELARLACRRRPLRHPFQHQTIAADFEDVDDPGAAVGFRLLQPPQAGGLEGEETARGAGAGLDEGMGVVLGHGVIVILAYSL